jgi:hypothetical protein
LRNVQYVSYICRMERTTHTPSTYAALRYGGASLDRARAELAITPDYACKLEAVFNVPRPGKLMDRMRPRFARHEAHVAAVLAGGGFPAIRR